MSNLRKTVLSKGSKRFDITNQDYSPVNWSVYFNSQESVTVGENKFNIYKKGDSGPLLVTLHGGGYSALTWSLFAEDISNKIECQLLAIDLRGHGNSETDIDSDMALETLSNDVANVVNTIYCNQNIPPIILIGHSMGGAVAVETAQLIPSVVGVCVIDVVEGTALESLSSMQSILRSRPTCFKSVEYAIQWCFRSGQTHNLQAARVSMPGQIRNKQTKQLAANETDMMQKKESFEVTVIDEDDVGQRTDVIKEEDEDGINNVDDIDVNSTLTSKPPLPNTNSNKNEFLPPTASVVLYEWRIDLSKTEQFWSGWFKGLSQKFLDLSVPKVLILANIQGLDTSLTIGQMQGKFQLQVLPKSGHAIHEDQPDRVADIIAGFLVKQKLVIPKDQYTVSFPAC